MQVQRVQQNNPQFTGVSYRYPEGLAKKHQATLIETLPDETRRYIKNAINFNNRLAHVDLNIDISLKNIVQSIQHGKKVYTGTFEPIKAEGNILQIAVKSENNNEQILNIPMKDHSEASNFYQELKDTPPMQRALGVAFAWDKSLSKLNLNA